MHLMAYDEHLAARMRALLSERDDVSEKKMFGGLAFMIDGNMCLGIVGADLMVRVGREAWEACLAMEGARPMDFTGRPMRGYVYVGTEALATQSDLGAWIGRGVAFVKTLPAKTARTAKKKSAKKKSAKKKSAKKKSATRAVSR
jgi:TfoX/Sxy family transcriptional regulator of competence genes